MTIEQILTDHQYGFYFKTNCACSAPGIRHWTDWVDHVVPLLEECMDKPVSNAPSGWINRCCAYGRDCSECYSRSPDDESSHHCETTER